MTPTGAEINRFLINPYVINVGTSSLTQFSKFSHQSISISSPLKINTKMKYISFKSCCERAIDTKMSSFISSYINLLSQLLQETNETSERTLPFGVASFCVGAATLETRHRIFHGLLQKFPITRSVLVAVTVVNPASRQTRTCLASSCTPPSLPPITPCNIVARSRIASAPSTSALRAVAKAQRFFIVTRIASSRSRIKIAGERKSER